MTKHVPPTGGEKDILREPVDGATSSLRARGAESPPCRTRAAGDVRGSLAV
ncbi:hypothetical protein ACWGI8_21410 [Streptomyces sp. NPDC054841]